MKLHPGIRISHNPITSGRLRQRLASRQQDRYFEHHIKLLLEPATNLQPLSELLDLHSAQLSRNAFQIRRDNDRERFITQRCMLVGQIEAKKQLNLLLGAIDSLEYPVLSIAEEFVVYDSNLDLDRGWIH